MKKVQSAKKLFAMLIALVMVFSVFSVLAFAAEQDNLNPSSGDVLVKYDDGGHPATYSVDITWGAMKFDYKANEVWNPETHKWEVDLDNTYCEPVDDSNIITVANHSSVPVDAEFYFEGLSEYGEIDSRFFSDNETFSISSLAMPVAEENAEAEKIDVEFRLWKDFSSDLEDYTKVGTITVTLSDHDVLRYERINNGTEYAVASLYDSDVTDVTVPSKHNGKPVTRINDRAFTTRTLETITLNEGLQVIGESAFDDCRFLKSVHIPASVNQIGIRAFCRCESLTTMTVDSNNTTFHSDGNCVIETATKELVVGCPASVIPNDGSVTKIGDYALYCCYGLTNIEFNSHITEIGELAVANIQSLVSVTLPDGVSKIGGSAFRRNSNLTSITIPSAVDIVTDDYWNAFRDSPALYVIRTDDASAFTFGSTDKGLIATNAKVIIDGNGINYKTEEDGTTYLLKDDFLYSVKDGEYTLIAYVGKSDTVTLPATIESKPYKMNEVKGLVNVTIPAGFTTIDDKAFYDAKGLENAIISEGVQSIGNSAFEGCSNFKSITIPASVTSIGDRAIFYSKVFYEINYGGTKAQWEAITKGEKWDAHIEFTVHCSDGDIVFDKW